MTKVQRWTGTAGASEDGCFVAYEDYLKLERDLQAAQSARVPVQHLADATRFKVTLLERDCRITNLPRELGGRWVALVAAENDCHLIATNTNTKELK